MLTSVWCVACGVWCMFCVVCCLFCALFFLNCCVSVEVYALCSVKYIGIMYMIVVYFLWCMEDG